MLFCHADGWRDGRKIRTSSGEKVTAVALTIDHDLNMRKCMNEADRIRYCSKEAIKPSKDLGNTSKRRKIFAVALTKTDYVIQMDGAIRLFSEFCRGYRQKHVSHEMQSGDATEGKFESEY